MSTTRKSRVECFEDILTNPQIDLKKLRRLCFSGCPYEKCIRSRCWKILLGYLPEDQKLWIEILSNFRKQYADFINEVIIRPGSNPTAACDDHPLNPNPDSQWQQYFKDNEMLLQIDKDCRRLYPGLGFFQKATEYPCSALVKPGGILETLRRRVERTFLESQNVSKTRTGVALANQQRLLKKPSAPSDEFVVLSEGEEAHWEVTERILFVYAKLNPGQGYVQGMNEIIGPIYYTFASDADDEWREFAEADTFWCFTNLMSEIRDNFIKAYDDNAHFGIGHLMIEFDLCLKSHDVSLWCHLQEQDLQPQYYAFRWLTLMLSQEFPLPDVLQLWDAFFADEKRFSFMISVCVAMLVLVREDLLRGDFPANMKLVQNYPGDRVHIGTAEILHKAAELAGYS